jgi:two-component system LytT family sensor kinase
MKMLNHPFEVRPAPRLAWKLTLVLWMTVLAFVAPTTIILGQVSSVGDYISVFWGLLSGIFISGVVYAAFKLMAGRPAWLAYPSLFLAILIATALQTLVDYGGQFALNEIFANFHLPAYDPKSVMAVAVVYFSLYTCNTALFWISFATEQSKRQQMRLAEAELDAVRSELAMLRMQINPHFMCNALGAISTMIIGKRYDDANLATERLATFLRDSAHFADAQDSRLADEFDIVDAYLMVEAVRFGDRLQPVLDCPEELESAIVPNFIIQPLVENAVQHAVSASGEPVSIRVSARREGGDLVLMVEDDGPGARAPRRSGKGGIGLANTRLRLKLRYGDAAALEAEAADPGFRAVIRLPHQTEAGPQQGSPAAA